MTDQDFRTLAYTKSPKTSKRTSFQDELQAAVSARASKTKTDRYSYSDDFNEDEDDLFNELLKSRKKRTEAFKAGKTKGRINNFELSDDENTQGRTKRVSFLKSQRIRSPSGDTTASELHGNEPWGDSISGHNNYSDSVSSQHSTHISSKNSDLESTDTDPQLTREKSSNSASYQASDDTLMDMPLPLPSDSSVIETPGPEFPSPSASDLKHVSLEDVTDKEPPRPKPRQRTLGLSLHAAEKLPEETESQDFSRTQTSSASIHLSTDTSSNIGWSAGDIAVSYSLSNSSTSKSEQSQLFTKSTVGSGSRDGFISDDSKERKYSTSFEELNEEQSDHSVAQPSQEKSCDTRASSAQSKTTQRSQSVCSRKVESKYLGTLKILDRNVSLQESQPQVADSLRAAIYQEWLKKKKESLRENMQQKKKEEMLKEKQKRDQEAKKEEAVASYAAWKEKKTENLKAKAKEKKEMFRKEQRVIEEKEEKKQSAKQVFEKWKHEHDQLLKEKYRKQKEAENKLKLKKQEKEEERTRESTYAFSNWCEKKKDVLNGKVMMERKEIKNKAEEERYIKEERDKMAADMYENWLVRKDLEQKRQREERRIQAILRDSPPPPWSPPNKTIPFGK
ncbi:microtubule-associated protein 9 [Anabas testudineus]|uniref:Microtubule-associated protein 9 n=1 Tax=Anabas testudineus TaxID=64144 RepID=A0A7N6AKW7_ANATE|nr:microtubule-associated protein 9 [Anabas testudineus]